MINQVLDAVRQVWHILEIAQPMPDSMHYVLQSRHRVIFFLFAQGNVDRPLVVVKLTRDPTQNHLLERSVERAQHVRMLLDDTMQATVPAMSLLGPINGLLGVAEQALPGEPFETAAISGSRDTVVNGCSAFADWLVRFQACTQTGSFGVTRDWLRSALVDPLEKMAGIDNRHRSLVEDMMVKLAGLQVPLVWAYGDTHPSNILLRDGRVSGIVDWEGTIPGQWPVFDWFQFILSLAQELIKTQYPRDRLQRAIVACSLLIGQPTTRLAAVLQQQTKRFLSLINLEPELALPLFLVFLVHYYWFDDKETLVQRVSTELHIPSS